MANTCMGCGKSIGRKSKRCRACNAAYISRLPEVRKARSEARYADWSDPEYRQKMEQPNPNRSAALTKLWKDGVYGTPEHLRNLSVGIKAACQRPEVKRRKSESAALSWKDPVVWEKHSEAMKAAHARGDHDNSEAMAAAWARGAFDGMFTEEVRGCMAASQVERWTPEKRQEYAEKFSGENNPNWRGGIAREPYNYEFNADLKLKIRTRDAFRCVLCAEPENGHAHDCHHADYDKGNDEESNLVTLCKSCHSRTNFDREYWQAYFTGVGYELMLGAC